MVGLVVGTDTALAGVRMSDGLWLIVDRRGATLSVEHQSVRVDEPDGSFRRVPPALLEAVVIHGRNSVASDVWRLLAGQGVPAVLLPGRGHGPAAWVGGGLGGSLNIRRSQFRAAEDAQGCLLLARRMVQRKFRGYMDALIWAGHGESTFQNRLLELQSHLDEAVTLEHVRGLEGAAARFWYDWLAERIPEEWRFLGRNRRPPRDPVNAMLSLGYTLLATQAHSRVEAAGLDVHLGFLHQPVPGRPALALDVMEPLRPWVDLFVLGLLDRVVGPADFSNNDLDGCRLHKEPRGRFYSAWAYWNREVPPAVSGDDDVESVSGKGVGAWLQAEVRSLRAELESIRQEISA